jgi:hypothetical protein
MNPRCWRPSRAEPGNLEALREAPQTLATAVAPDAQPPGPLQLQALAERLKPGRYT